MRNTVPLVALTIVYILFASSLQPKPEALISSKLKQATAKALYHGRSSSPALHIGQNSCKNRRPLASLFKRRTDSEAVSSDVFAKVFNAYSALHAACISSSNASHFPVPNASGCKFLVVEFGAPYGLGNKLLWLISAFLYAIITQRVLLIDTRFSLDKMLCDPFEGSSWQLPPHFPYTNAAGGSNVWTTSETFFTQSSDSKTTHRTRYPAVKLNTGWDLHRTFFTDKGQALLEDVPWLAFGTGGCLYIVPGFYLIPKFRKTLQAIFPHRDPATHLLRHLLVPDANIWSEIQKIKENYFLPAKITFSAQLRYFHGVIQGNLAIPGLTKCAITNGLIPDPRNSTVGNVTIFIASLYADLQDHLQELYPNSNVNIVQLSSNHVQHFDNFNSDNQALIEMIALSFSESLATTSRSTFGYIAQSLGRLRPWLVSPEENCTRGQSSEPCYQTVTPHDNNVVVQGLRKCQDYPKGYQLVSY